MSIRLFLTISGLLAICPLYGQVTKASVFVDTFIPVKGCKISEENLEILHDRVIGNVVSSRKYEVVERQNLAKVQAELKLVDAGMTEGDAPESNKLKAAGYCIYGKVLQFRCNRSAAKVGENSVDRSDALVEVQIRITNIANGKVLGTKTVKARAVDSKGISASAVSDRNTMSESLTMALDKAAKEVVFKLNDIAFPVYVKSINNRFVTGSVSEEQVTEGDIWEAYALGDEIDDGEYDEELVGRVRVSRPGAKSTKFEPVSESDKKRILEAWEEANEDGATKSGQRRYKMLLRRAPESAQIEKSPEVKSSGTKMPDMSMW